MTSKTPAPVHTGEKGSTNNKCPNCEKDITLQEVKDILLAQNKKPADDAWTQSSLDWLNYYRKARGINTCLRKAHFIAQVAHESGFDVNIEGFNYTKKGFTDTFRGNKQYKVDPTATADHIDKWCRENDAPKHPGVSLENQKKLADWMYALVDENGAEATGDGWAFRGRGFIQITHRGSYRKAYEFYLNDKSIAPDKKIKTNWLTDPDEVAKNAALAAYSASWE